MIRGDKRLFIEVFADTKEQDLRQAGIYIETAKTKYKIRGTHLFRYKDYYKHKLITSGKTPVDTMGMPVIENGLEDIPKFEKNIYKLRHNRYLKKDNSK